MIKTPAAEYICCKVCTSYKETYLHLLEQAEIAVEVDCSLAPQGPKMMYLSEYSVTFIAAEPVIPLNMGWQFEFV